MFVSYLFICTLSCLLISLVYSLSHYYVRNEEIKEKPQKFKLNYLESMNVKWLSLHSFKIELYHYKVNYTLYALFRKASSSSTKAMKLGSKSRDTESFVDQLKLEGENVEKLNKPSLTTSKLPTPSLANTDLWVFLLLIAVWWQSFDN